MCRLLHSFLICDLVFGLVTGSAAGAKAGLPAGEADALAARLMAAVRVIEQEHYDPPPRQEMAHRLMLVLAARLGEPQPVGLGRELSSIADTDELEARLRQFCAGLDDQRTLETDSERFAAIEQGALQDLLGSLWGPNFVRSRKDHLVDEQFANNRYVGTGISLSLQEETKVPMMATVFEDGPAQAAGARNGDLILEIDGESTEGMRVEDVVDRLRGPAGSGVKVRLRQPNENESRALTILRGVVPLKHTSLERREGSVIIRTHSLTVATVQELREFEEQLRETDSEIVLDLQDVDGINLHHAVILADALLDGGPIGHSRTARGVQEFEASPDCLFRDRRLKVQVSPDTGGTIEWVVAAIQDNSRATIIGQRTAGTPFFAEAFEVPGTDWVLKLTCGVLERADGRSLLRTDRLRSRPSSGDTHRIVRRGMAISNDGQNVDPSEHDGGVLPDEVIDLKPRVAVRPPFQPTHRDRQSIIERIFGGSSESE